MKKPHNDVVDQVNHYIFEHIDQNISIPLIAQQVDISRFHLQRLFYAVTGFQLAEYIQRRKMERALYLLEDQKLSVIDVAIAVGYESHSAFSRAFKNTYNFSPNDFKQGQQPPPSLIQQRKKSPKQPSDNLNVFWLSQRKFCAYGEYLTNFPPNNFFSEVSECFTRLMANYSSDDFVALKPMIVTENNPWHQDIHQGSLFVGYQTVVQSESITTFNNEAEHWLCFEYTGHFKFLWQFIARIHAYITDNQINLSSRQIIHQYLTDPLKTPPEQWRVDLYFPIKTTKN